MYLYSSSRQRASLMRLLSKSGGHRSYERGDVNPYQLLHEQLRKS